MHKYSLDSIGREQQQKAAAAPAKRAAETVYGGRECVLRQTVVALGGGSELAEHDSPGEATVLVLTGRIRLVAGEDAWEARQGDFLIVPAARHKVEAVTDATFLLTVAKARR